MTENLQKDQKFIQDVFNKVYSKYDLMNDLMSFGIHRNWKKQLVTTMNPGKDQSLIDVGCGTGDIGKLFSLATNYIVLANLKLEVIFRRHPHADQR